jgi:hypothetical protein
VNPNHLECMGKITVDEVFRAVSQMLKERNVLSHTLK